MNKQQIIEQATALLAQLPDERAQQVWDLLRRVVHEAQEDADLQAHYTKLVANREEEELRQGIAWLVEHGGAFDFLHDEPDIYHEEDIKVRYNHDHDKG